VSMQMHDALLRDDVKFTFLVSSYNCFPGASTCVCAIIQKEINSRGIHVRLSTKCQKIEELEREAFCGGGVRRGMGRRYGKLWEKG